MPPVRDDKAEIQTLDDILELTDVVEDDQDEVLLLEEVLGEDLADVPYGREERQADDHVLDLTADIFADDDEILDLTEVSDGVELAGGEDETSPELLLEDAMAAGELGDEDIDELLKDLEEPAMEAAPPHLADIEEPTMPPLGSSEDLDMSSAMFARLESSLEAAGGLEQAASPAAGPSGAMDWAAKSIADTDEPQGFAALGDDQLKTELAAEDSGLLEAAQPADAPDDALAIDLGAAPDMSALMAEMWSNEDHSPHAAAMPEAMQEDEAQLTVAGGTEGEPLELIDIAEGSADAHEPAATDETLAAEAPGWAEAPAGQFLDAAVARAGMDLSAGMGLAAAGLAAGAMAAAHASPPMAAAMTTLSDTGPLAERLASLEAQVDAQQAALAAEQPSTAELASAVAMDDGLLEGLAGRLEGRLSDALADRLTERLAPRMEERLSDALSGRLPGIEAALGRRLDTLAADRVSRMEADLPARLDAVVSRQFQTAGLEALQERLAPAMNQFVEDRLTDGLSARLPNVEAGLSERVRTLVADAFGRFESDLPAKLDASVSRQFQTAGLEALQERLAPAMNQFVEDRLTDGLSARLPNVEAGLSERVKTLVADAFGRFESDLPAKLDASVSRQFQTAGLEALQERLAPAMNQFVEARLTDGLSARLPVVEAAMAQRLREQVKTQVADAVGRLESDLPARLEAMVSRQFQTASLDTLAARLAPELKAGVGEAMDAALPERVSRLLPNLVSQILPLVSPILEKALAESMERDLADTIAGPLAAKLEDGLSSRLAAGLESRLAESSAALLKEMDAQIERAVPAAAARILREEIQGLLEELD